MKPLSFYEQTIIAILFLIIRMLSKQLPDDVKKDIDSIRIHIAVSGFHFKIMNYSAIQLFQDIANQASADRAGNWLLLAENDFPWLFDAITKNLKKPPEYVLEQIKNEASASGNIAIKMMIPAMLQSVDLQLSCAFIAKLQEFFKEKGYK